MSVGSLAISDNAAFSERGRTSDIALKMAGTARLSARGLQGGLNGSKDRRIACAAAQVARQRDLDLIERSADLEWRRCEDHSGSTNAALRAAMHDERVLQRLAGFRRSGALDRDHTAAFRMRDGDDARIHGDTVDQHGAGAALAFAAAFFRSGQAAVLAKHIEQ